MTFKIPPRQARLTCKDCGQEYRGAPDSAQCQQCNLYESHPDLAPKYWTWTRTSSSTGWNAVCTWPEHEDLPPPGTEITVHRKNRSNSNHVVTEVLSHHYDMSGNMKITCSVQQTP